MSLMMTKQVASLTDLPSLPSTFPASLTEIINKMCAFAPEARYQTADELKIVLDRFLAGRTPSDRRRGLRMPDDVYRRMARRRTVIGSVVATVVSCVGTMLWLHRDDFSAERPAAPNSVDLMSTSTNVSAVNLIDRLADESQEDMVNIVTDYLQESLGGTSKEMAFSDEHRQEILTQVDEIGNKIRTTGLTQESLDTFLDKYRQTALPDATRVMRVTALVFQSGLKDAEKKQGVALLRRLGAATVAGKIPEQTTNALLTRLTGNRSSTVEIASMQISDAQLRAWLAQVAAVVKNVKLDVNEERRIVTEQLQDVFDTAFGED